MKEFNTPWMSKCNPDLILRFWRHKGSPGTLTIKKYGVHIKYTNTPFGELAQVFPRTDVWIENFIYDPKPCTIDDLY